MAGYICAKCGKKTRLPEFCCGKSMAQQGMYYCDKCGSQSNKANNCCGSPMRML